jgi:hypothetical protein
MASRKPTKDRSITSLIWEHQFAAIFKCSPRAAEPEEIVIATGDEIDKDADLKRVLEALQRDLIFKRIYKHADNPTTRLLGFRTYPTSEVNSGQTLLKSLLDAKTKREVQKLAGDLANRYLQTRSMQEGVLIFLLSKGRLEDEGLERVCVFVFKCDFEKISQVTAGKVFRRVKDAIVEQTKKGGLYPYFDWGRFDETTIRVFDERGETRYWLDFLDLGERPSRYLSLQEVTISELSKIRPELASETGEKLQALSLSRSLDNKDRIIDSANLLALPQAKRLIAGIVQQTGDREITLHLDKIKVKVPLSEFGITWMISEERGQHYILIKGAKLDVHSTMLNPLDLSAAVNLKKAAAELGLNLQ